MKTLGLGVIGLGEGSSIISAGLSSERWDVVALCDLNEELCRERCAQFGLTKYTTSMDEVLANEAVDVVGIYTPDHLHAEHVIRALRAGKHVVCTKPFLDNLTHAREVLDVSRHSDRLVMVGQSSRFFAPFIRGQRPRPDVTEGIVTVALMQAMEESTLVGRPVRIADVLARHGLAELA